MQYIEKIHQDQLVSLTGDPFREKHYGRIKITSGEQFVPLYLSLFTTCPTPLKYHYFPDGTRKAFIKEIQTGDDIKQQLTDLLTLFVPAEYTFVRPVRVDNSGTEYQKCFLGQGPPNYPYRNNLTWMSTFGLWATWSEGQGMVLKSKHYAALNYPQNFQLSPQVLIVIKAKHLAYVRACKLLNAPMCKLPYSDIKVLRITAIDNTGQSLINTLRDQFSDINIKIVDTSVLKNLLMERPARQSREQFLANAKGILNNPTGKLQECIV